MTTRARGRKCLAMDYRYANLHADRLRGLLPTHSADQRFLAEASAEPTDFSLRRGGRAV